MASLLTAEGPWATRKPAVGDLVEWKPGLKNSARPMAGERAVIIETLQEPMRIWTEGSLDTTRSGGRYDIIIAMMDSDGELLHFPSDSRRFQVVAK